MNNRSQIIIWLTVSLFLCLLFYSSLDLIVPTAWLGQSSWSNLYKISQLSITIIIFLLFTRLSFITKLFCFISGENFIAGEYIGESWDYLTKEDKNSLNTTDNNHQEKFIIKQSIFEVTISGQSFDLVDYKPVSSWYGKLFKHDDNHYYFALELSVNYGEYAILKVTFDDDSAMGFYYSGYNKKPCCSAFQAKRISSSKKNVKPINNQEHLSEFFQDSPLAEVEIDLSRDKNLSDKDVS